jgi:TolB-like protein
MLLLFWGALVLLTENLQAESVTVQLEFLYNTNQTRVYRVEIMNFGWREISKVVALDSAKGVVAISGFTTKTGKSSDLIDLLNEMAVVEIGRIDTLTLVEREKLDALLAEQELTLSDLMDTEQAIEVGRFLDANYIVTGSVIEMAASVVIFGRIINVETGEVESVAQVIVPMDPDVKKLLT